jgi:Domain of unknown function (DUF397)
MADALRSELLFRSSSRCSTGGCVEVALLPDGGVAVRDSGDRTHEPLAFDKWQWLSFIAFVKNGEFDL